MCNAIGECWNLFSNVGGKGDKGDLGEKGVKGFIGPQGIVGEQGIQGPIGNQVKYLLNHHRLYQEMMFHFHAVVDLHIVSCRVPKVIVVSKVN